MKVKKQQNSKIENVNRQAAVKKENQNANKNTMSDDNDDESSVDRDSLSISQSFVSARNIFKLTAK